MSEQTADEFMDDLNRLIDRAISEDKVMYCRSHDLHFRPEELRKLNAEGKFRWGAVNWILMSKTDAMTWYDTAIRRAEKHVEKLREQQDRFADWISGDEPMLSSGKGE